MSLSTITHELSLKPLDSNRQISDEEKIAAYGKANGCCEKCGKEFKDYKEAEYHHIELYSNGGQTTIENIMVLCSDCHDDIHREKPKSISVDEIEESIDEEN